MAFSPQLALSRTASLITRLSPAAQLGILILVLVALTTISEFASHAIGANMSLLNKNGGTVILTLVALVGLLAIVASQHRPMSEYGLVAGRKWWKRAITGLAIGGAVYGSYLALCVGAGIYTVHTESITISRVAKSLLAIVSSLPLATVQQIIFAGLLIGLFRKQLGRSLAVMLSALVFGAAVGAGAEGGFTSDAGLRLVLGMSLLAALLGGLRLASGSIVLPAGVLAGAIMIRRVPQKLHLLAFNPESPWADWLAPMGDPRQGILFALVMVVCIASVAAWIARRGEARVESDASVDASFKRIMPFSNLLTFISLDRWIVLLVQARFRVSLAYIPRLVVTLIGSAIGTVLALPERIVAPLLLNHDVPDPVFVVGIHRTGTTHLHNLLALDPQFRAPRNYEVFNPLGFLTGWITTALMTPALMWRRPMDSVQMTPFSSQEEEFALTAMGSPSPYAAFCLPKQSGRHWKFMHADGFQTRELQRWKRDYNLFLRKITWRARRKPLLKNPANTGRISLLKQMYPRAKFVYLVRNPDDVYRSNMHFARQGLIVFQLQDPDPTDNYATHFLDNYRRVSTAAERDMSALENGQGIRLRFEDIETDPLASIRQLYESLGLEFTFEYQRKLKDYLHRNKDYRKNLARRLPDDEALAVRNAMGRFFVAWGYNDEMPSRRAA